MRLLHTTNFQIQEFFRNVPKYAIVSHRWSEEEVTFQEFLRCRGSFLAGRESGYGWMKIAKACQIARDQDGLEWVWIDTCCINKESSAELSEAINSMWEYYKQADVCYVFLPDVQPIPGSGNRFATFDKQEFKASSWFTRAWTLQELLAPQRSFFFNASFDCIGTHRKLIKVLSEASSIPREYLLRGSQSVSMACLAERMRWASKREATRTEDIAYSLLGLFNVNMPLLYGEGEKAFVRLQTEIIKISDDESIFAWAAKSHDRIDRKGLLAPHISNFTNNVFKRVVFAREHYEATNKGIRLNLSLPRRRILELFEENHSITVLVPLNCLLYEEDIKSRGLSSVLCLRVVVNLDPQWANELAPNPRHLKYLLGLRSGLELICISRGHELQMAHAVDRVRHDFGTDLVSGLGAEDEVDIPVYFRDANMVYTTGRIQRLR